MKKKRKILAVLLGLSLLAGCGKTNGTAFPPVMPEAGGSDSEETIQTGLMEVTPTAERMELEDGLAVVSYEGDYALDAFLEQGGASSDQDVVEFLTHTLLGEEIRLSMNIQGFGCSTLSAQSPEGHELFGRNFDWDTCNALVLQTRPKNGYSSISTVNLDFLAHYDTLPDGAAAIAAVYAPLDGMNEKGLAAAVLMIQDNASIEQSSDKPDITTTTAIRLLLDKAASVDEALDLLEQYDLHASMGMMIHFAIADAQGNSVAVEYIGNEMVVTETPVLTNFYLTEGEKQGVGTAQSHTRYDILTETLEQNDTLTLNGLRDAMDSVSKKNFGEFESTEWTVIYDQSTGEVRYYHREHYQDGYLFRIK